MGIEYKDIVKANEALNTVNIKGKDYVEVNQRIKAFRMNHPLGSITTEVLELDDERIVIRATVSTEDGQILGTGTAFELKSSSYINKTSYVENCETSATGRALGMCGYGVDASIASAEDVANAIHQQGETKTITQKQMKELQKLMVETETDANKFLDYFEIDEVSGMTVATYNKAVQMLEAKKKKGVK